ncbi:MAG: DsrE/DsrF/DrsH-like family protein, partial [Rhodospirillales bacterium]|nr:DsrE/DsrF/DrsH-like family protein [Rhodospirillales bacterium]
MMNPNRPDKLSIVVFAGQFDKVHYALVMAAAAAAIDTPVTLLFTMEAVRNILRAEADGTPSWATQTTTMCLETGADMDASFKENGVADFETLLAACRDLGVRFLVCEMGLRALGLSRDDIRADLPIELGGVVTFL